MKKTATGQTLDEISRGSELSTSIHQDEDNFCFHLQRIQLVEFLMVSPGWFYLLSLSLVRPKPLKKNQGTGKVGSKQIQSHPVYQWKRFSFRSPKLRYFASDSVVKESASNEGDLGLIPGLGRFPWRREQLPTPVFWPGEFHEQRSLVGHSPGVATSQTRLNNLHKLTSFGTTLICLFHTPLWWSWDTSQLHGKLREIMSWISEKH